MAGLGAAFSHFKRRKSGQLWADVPFQFQGLFAKLIFTVFVTV